MVDRANAIGIGVIVLALLTVGVVVSDAPDTASIFGEPKATGGTGTSSSSSGNSASTQKLFATVNVNGCNDAEDEFPGFDNCYEHSVEAGDSEALSVILANDVDILGTRDGAWVVEPGTAAEYKCVEGATPSTEETKAYITNEIDQEPDVNVDKNGIESSEQRISNSGFIELDFSSPTEVQLNCITFSSADDGSWASSGVWFYYNQPFVGAQDTDGDGIYNINDECPRQGDQGYGITDDGCPKTDSDSDGVVDSEDECPDTPTGAPVDSNGCVGDSDGDGVPDYQDQCPQEGDQGFGLKNNGCPIEDSDGDGVANPNDQCASTPEGVSVDSNGCAKDSDDDGVPDHKDECPGTTNPQLGVNSQGCAIQDQDQDGVIDRVDQCPQTYGSQTSGCPNLVDRIINVLGLRGLI